MNVFRPAIALACLAVSGCAALPMKTMADLDQSSDAWKSPACLAARQKAMAYDDQTALRHKLEGDLAKAHAGVYALPVVGLVGLVKDGQRRSINAELASACGLRVGS